MIRSQLMRRLRTPIRVVWILLAIEFLDEFIFGAREAAWPLIRTDLGLSYGEVGLLLSIPLIVSSVIEPIVGILGDTGWRRGLILGGGLLVIVAAIITAVGQSFGMFLASTILFYPASGAFVSLSQATLMDSDPQRHEQNMARWAFVGSLGVVAGPLALGGFAILGFGWRAVYVFFALLAALAVIVARRAAFATIAEPAAATAGGLKAGLRAAWRAMWGRNVLRWLVMLQFSDLMLDGLHGYLALYFVDVAGASAVQAGLAVMIWTGVGLVGDFLLIPLLERVRGLTYLRYSVASALALFPAFLLVEALTAKLIILALMGFFNAGWYSILQGRLYSAMPGRSGTVMSMSALFGTVGGLMPLLIGLLAGRFGLGAALWLVLLGPLVMLVGLRGVQSSPPVGSAGSTPLSD